MTTTSVTAAADELAEAVRMSTAPAPVGPPRPRQLLAPVRRAWRQLTSMRTALLLLFLLALGSVPGGFLPQRSLNPVAVQDYLGQHPSLGPLLDRLFLFDVFAAPWFAAVYLLLFVSLAGCLVPRIRLHARALRKPPPPAPRRLDRLPASARWEVDDDPDVVLDRARRTLRGWRRVTRDGAVCAERGYLRETGNLVFHVSLVVLLVAVAVGAFFGFKGTVLVKEGDGFANEILNFDDITPGRRFAENSLVPLNFQLDAFNATYGPDGAARTFDAQIRYAPDPEAPLRPYDVRVNHPLHVGAAKVYLIGHGYAPVVEVRDAAGELAFPAQAVPCLPQDPKFLSRCVIKVPDTRGEQLAFEGVFTPTTVQNAQGNVASAHPAVTSPALTLVAYRGDVGLDSGVPGSVYELDKRRLTAVDGGTPNLIGQGQTWDLPGGGSITFLRTTEWATFQVTQDPGKLLALIASCGIVLGLCLSLFVRRRRLWVRVLPGGAQDGHRRTVVEVGGLARSDPEAFADELAEIVQRLGGPVSPDRIEQRAPRGRTE